MEIIGFRDGFRGLVENRRLKLDRSTLAGILTVGGTILGTSRDKPHRMVIDGRTRDMTETIVDNYDKWGLDCIVCLFEQPLLLLLPLLYHLFLLVFIVLAGEGPLKLFPAALLVRSSRLVLCKCFGGPLWQVYYFGRSAP